MWSDEIILNRKNGLREAWPDDRLFKYKDFTVKSLILAQDER